MNGSSFRNTLWGVIAVGIISLIGIGVDGCLTRNRQEDALAKVQTQAASQFGTTEARLAADSTRVEEHFRISEARAATASIRMDEESECNKRAIGWNQLVGLYDRDKSEDYKDALEEYAKETADICAGYKLEEQQEVGVLALNREATVAECPKDLLGFSDWFCLVADPELPAEDSFPPLPFFEQDKPIQPIFVFPTAENPIIQTAFAPLRTPRPNP